MLPSPRNGVTSVEEADRGDDTVSFEPELRDDDRSLISLGW